MGNYKERYEVAYEMLTDDALEGAVSCGFLPKDMEESEHDFDFYSGFLIISGKGKYIEGDQIVKEIGQGDFVQRRPGIKHVTTVEEGEPWLEFYICFGPSLYETLVTTHMISDQPVLRTALNPRTIAKCEDVLKSFKNSTSENKKNLYATLQSFLFYINQLSNESLDYHCAEKEKMDMMHEVCIILGRDFYKKMDYEELAKEFQVSYESFRKTFKRYTGMSPSRYRLVQKINKARQMLEETDLTLKAIAMELGYADPYAFSSQFKKVVGLSPKKYRED